MLYDLLDHKQMLSKSKYNQEEFSACYWFLFPDASTAANFVVNNRFVKISMELVTAILFQRINVSLMLEQ